MSTNQIMSKVESLLYWEKIMEEAKAEADTLRAELKQEMINRNTEELTVGQYIIRWTSVLSQRFDATAFKKVMPEIYRAYTKQVASRRFTIA
jgi:predicted phage-related endonuclease